jgi:hypothetical protein
MDASRFDVYVRSLAPRSMSSRREWLARLIAVTTVLPLALVDEAVDAKGKKRRRNRKRKKKSARSCRPNCSGGPCTNDGCGGVCPCSGAGICTEAGTCCDPEGTPCTTFEGCCSQTCDSLVGGGTCAPCRGRSCSATRPCCGGLDCVNGYCDGCRDRATSCTSSSQCCFSDCTSGACLSASGGRCARDVDCRACYLSHNCTNACVGGVCAF